MAQWSSPNHYMGSCVQGPACLYIKHIYELMYRMLLDLMQLPEISCHAEMAQQAQNWVLDFRWQGQLETFVC